MTQRTTTEILTGAQPGSGSFNSGWVRPARRTTTEVVSRFCTRDAGSGAIEYNSFGKSAWVPGRPVL